MGLKKAIAILSAACLPISGAAWNMPAAEAATVCAGATTGYCGTSLRWYFNRENGTLSISGNGKMTDYSLRDRPTWVDWEDSITNIELENGVTAIGSYAFYKLSNLSSVTMADTIVSVGAHAFENCDVLKTVQFSESLESIGDYAFYFAVLDTLNLPDELETIGEEAFSYNSTLKEITIPNKVLNIGAGAFYGCSGAEKIQLSERMEEIPERAFTHCSELKKISIPANIKCIGKEAFMFCTKLPEILLPVGVETIDEDAFYGCTKLKKVMILNPDCEIFDSASTIMNRTVTVTAGGQDVSFFDGVIQGVPDSAVQAYADKYERPFEPLNYYDVRTLGDITMDGTVNAADALMALNAFAETMTGNPMPLNAYQQAAADVNNDREVTAIDAQYILLYFIQNSVMVIPTDWADLIV